MFLSMNWISDFVDLSGLDKLALIQQFSLSTAEVENDIFFKGSDISGIVVAEIMSVEAHPDSKKLHLLKVDAGDGALTDVVCGAPNVRVGMKTAFAKVGAQIGEITIAPRKLAGYTSNGMCCGEAEIGISDDNSGIMEITDDIPNGTDLKTVYEIDDIVFEVDNKSLTNRPDLWGHYGIAREFAALAGRELKPLPSEDLNAYNELAKVDMKIEDPLCQRYSCLQVENITRTVSPVNMRIRYLGSELECRQEDFLFEKAYGTAAIDGADGKVPQTLNFFIRLEKGTAFSFEIDATSDSGARSFITDLAVASCRDAGKPFTHAEASAYPRYFDATAVGVAAPAQQREGGSVLYDLSGRRVTVSPSMPRGIFIRGGRKLVR